MALCRYTSSISTQGSRKRFQGSRITGDTSKAAACLAVSVTAPVPPAATPATTTTANAAAAVIKLLALTAHLKVSLPFITTIIIMNGADAIATISSSVTTTAADPARRRFDDAGHVEDHMRLITCHKKHSTRPKVSGDRSSKRRCQCAPAGIAGLVRVRKEDAASSQSRSERPEERDVSASALDACIKSNVSQGTGDTDLLRLRIGLFDEIRANFHTDMVGKAAYTT